MSQLGPNPPFPHGLTEVSTLTIFGGGLGSSHLGPVPPFEHGGKYSFVAVVVRIVGRVVRRVVVRGCGYVTGRVIGWVGLVVGLCVVRIVGLVGTSQFGPLRVIEKDYI